MAKIIFQSIWRAAISRRKAVLLKFLPKLNKISTHLCGFGSMRHFFENGDSVFCAVLKITSFFFQIL